MRSNLFELMIGVEMEKSNVISPYLADQNIFKSSIETAGFGAIPGRITNTAYVETQWQAFTQREATSFAIQATAQDWIKGAYYSVAQDRFIVTDAAPLQDSLVQGLSTIGNRPDAVFAAVTLDRLRSDGCDLQASNDATYELVKRRAA